MCVNVSSQEIVEFPCQQFLVDLFSQALADYMWEFGDGERIPYSKEHSPN
jgi:hypothetical protein